MISLITDSVKHGSSTAHPPVGHIPAVWYSNYMHALKHLKSAAVTGKVVLVRVDFNVPLTTNNGVTQVADDRRLRVALPTIQYLQEKGAKVVLISHLGRPKSSQDLQFSLSIVAEYLRKKLDLEVAFCPQTVGPQAEAAVAELAPGQVLLLENLRYYPEEKANDASFGKSLAGLAELYVNEAFSASHRSHASIVGVTQHIPGYAGLALETEVKTLSALLEKPRRPFVVVLGGAKISDKVGLLTKLSSVADIVLIGGAAANTFLKAEGFEIYRSYVEEASSAGEHEQDFTRVAADIIKDHKTERILKDGYIPLPKILYPIDVIAAPSLDVSDVTQVKTVDLSHDMADTDESEQLLYLDIGPKTRKLYSEVIAQAGTVFWNGPMGVWENELLRAGTKAVGSAIAKSDARSVIGGGDTIAAADALHLEKKFSYVSAAGGAALELLSGETLPGIKPILSKTS